MSGPSSTGEEVRRLLTQVAKHYQAGDLTKALALIEHALTLAPRGAVIYYNKALVLFKMKRLNEAEKACRTALQLSPTAPRAKQLLERIEAEARLQAELKVPFAKAAVDQSDMVTAEIMDEEETKAEGMTEPPTARPHGLAESRSGSDAKGVAGSHRGGMTQPPRSTSGGSAPYLAPRRNEQIAFWSTFLTCGWGVFYHYPVAAADMARHKYGQNSVQAARYPWIALVGCCTFLGIPFVFMWIAYELLGHYAKMHGAGRGDPTTDEVDTYSGFHDIPLGDSLVQRTSWVKTTSRVDFFGGKPWTVLVMTLTGVLMPLGLAGGASELRKSLNSHWNFHRKQSAPPA